MGFPKSDGSEIDIIARIGDKDNVLGIQLLNDDDGTKTDALEKKFSHDPYRISLHIFKLWLQGQGKKPITWGTLVNVLKRINLNALANDIETSLK